MATEERKAEKAEASMTAMEVSTVGKVAASTSELLVATRKTTDFSE
jgi:hypothetical protein